MENAHTGNLPVENSDADKPTMENPDAENPEQSQADIPLNTTTKVPVNWLELDRRNPRLAFAGEKPDDVEIIGELYRSEDLSELLESIASNGYLDIEPLVVLGEKKPLTVLEGNRRLAAIRLLETPALAKPIFDRTGARINIPNFPEQFRSTISEVSVYRVVARAAARSFIGFKHINGAAKWKSYAKARFAAEWYRDEGTPLEEIAAQIGDKHDTVKRMVNGIYVLEQADEANIFHLSDRASPRFNFSHLYTALSRTPYMQFLGLVATWASFDPKPNPIPEENSERLGEVLRWLYGSKQEDIRPVIHSQNPDIRRLGEVLNDPEATMILRASKSLDEAHFSTAPANQRFYESLIRARAEVREASNNLRGFDGLEQSSVGIAEDILETVQALHARMIVKVKETEAARP